MSSFVQLVEACEAAYRHIQEENPDVPECVVLIGSGGSRAKNLLGHFAPDRWATGEELKNASDNLEEDSEIEVEVYHEILIVAEQLHRGARAVFTTLMHEAVHGIAQNRKIKDVSGRRHNKRFKAICEEIGLEPPESPDKYLGFSSATLPDSTAWIYENDIKAIDAALSLVRLFPSEKEKVKNSWKAVCDCERTIRVGKKIYNGEDQDIKIACVDCGGRFMVLEDDE
jgi:hypothetical protein